MLMETQPRDHFMLKIGREVLQVRQQPVPIVQRRLQRRRNVAGIGAPGEIVRHHDELAVAAMLQTR